MGSYASSPWATKSRPRSSSSGVTRRPTVAPTIQRMIAVPALVPADYFPKSAEILAKSGNAGLFVAHIKAVLISYGFVGIGTAIILWIVGATVGLRVTPEEEERGLDFVAHGEEAYDPMTY